MKSTMTHIHAPCGSVLHKRPHDDEGRDQPYRVDLVCPQCGTIADVYLWIKPGVEEEEE